MQSRASHSAKRTDDCLKSVIDTDTEPMQLLNLGDSCEGHNGGSNYASVSRALRGQRGQYNIA